MAKAHNIVTGQRTTDVLIQENIRFADMYLKDRILQGLEAAGFVKPSPIQLKAIPVGRCGTDLIIQSKSGTGKTCVFTVIALEMLDPSSENLQILVMAPTREIAYQIQQVVKSIGSKFEKLQVSVFMGGTSINEDIRLAKKCQIAVGSPGRIKHLIKEKFMDVSCVRLFILDEADRLMEKPFCDDIRYIHSALPNHKQVIGASATYPEELENFMASQLQIHARRIQPETDLTSSPLLLGLKQFLRVIPHHTSPLVQIRLKTQQLYKILSAVTFKQCLVFCNFQSRLAGICRELNAKSWPAAQISGSMPQSERLKVLKNLQEFRCRILLTTDLTSRGIDAEHVDLIVNLDLPYDVSTYLHRVGRAGRFGTHGIVISVVHEGSEFESFRKIIFAIGQGSYKMPKLPEDLKGDLWTMSENGMDFVEGIPDKYVYESNANKSAKTEKVNPVEKPIQSNINVIKNYLKSQQIEDNFKTYEELLHNFENFTLTAESSELDNDREPFQKIDFPAISNALVSVLNSTLVKRPISESSEEEDEDQDQDHYSEQDSLCNRWMNELNIRRKYKQLIIYHRELCDYSSLVLNNR